MAKVTVGGKEYNVKPLVFETLEKVWPLIEQIQEIVRQSGGDHRNIKSPITVMKPGVAAIALMIAQDDAELQAVYEHPEHNGKSEAELDQIVIKIVSKKITAVETQAIEPAINEIMAEAGFKAEEAAPSGEPEASPSTATSTGSSQSLSPPAAKEEAGTE